MPVDTKHPAYEGAARLWAKCRDVVAGQEAVHAGGKTYLPHPSGYSASEYEAYKERALFYNATGRTVDGMSGLVFRRPPAVEIPASAEFLRSDIDSAGTPLLTLCEKTVEDLLVTGRVGMLADYPTIPLGATAADARFAGARPRVRMYRAEDIINWRVDEVRNRWQLTLVVLSECAEVRKDEFTTERVRRLRVLSLASGTYEVSMWQENENTNEWSPIGDPAQPRMNGKPMDFIPFVICGPMGSDPNVVKPPILDLVNVNLSHYRTTADYEHGLHFTGLPTPVVTGHAFEANETFPLGSSSIKAFANPDAKVFFLEFEGGGLSNLSKRLEEKEQMMVSLGARMLASQQRGVEAAETAAIHRSAENSVLASLANAAGGALTTALTWCVLWTGSQEPARVPLNTDYLPTGLSAQELTALVAAWQSRAISHETLYDNLQRGEIAQQGVAFDSELGRIDAQGPALGSIGGQGAAGAA